MINYNKALLNAVAAGNPRALEVAIAGGVDIHAQAEKKPFDSSPVTPPSIARTALELAISVTKDQELRPEHLLIVRRLIEIGADVNSKHLLDVSSYPLQKAVHTKHKELFDLLIELGATFWTSGSEGYELIRWAAYYGLDWLVVRFLERLGQPPDEEVQHGLEYALCGAARQGHLEIVRRLLDFGVNPDARESNSTALMGAAMSGHREVAELLIERGADIHAQGDRGLTALIAAAYGGLTELGLRLLNEGANVHATDFSGRTPLHGAAAVGDEVLARELILRGANTSARDDGSHSVLHSAAYSGNRWIIHACLDAGVDVNAQDNWGYTPLMSAARAGHIEAMKILVDRGANIHHVAHYLRETALYFAIIGKHTDAVLWLLEQGAEAEAMVVHDDERVNLLGVAASENDVELARLLVRFGAQPTPDVPTVACPPLHQAAWWNALEMIAFLLSLGVPVDSRDVDDNTPLLCVPSAEAARVLLEAGANPNAQGLGCSYTKLWIAANYGLLEMGKVLLEYGADPLIRDTASNRTPYEVALENGYTDFVQMLEEHFPNSF